MRYLFVLFFIYSISAFGQERNFKQKIITLSDNIRATVPRQKIYAHLDKSIKMGKLIFLLLGQIKKEPIRFGLKGLICREISELKP